MNYSSNILILMLIGTFIINHVVSDSSSCYSCSTLAGARKCTFDDFDKSSVPKLDCPKESNICATLRVLNGANKGAVLRSCGIASANLNETICAGGYFSPSGSCLTYKCTGGSFANSDVQVCSCKKPSSNDNDIDKCQ